jgi:hypothetical protein
MAGASGVIKKSFGISEMALTGSARLADYGTYAGALVGDRSPITAERRRVA